MRTGLRFQRCRFRIPPHPPASWRHPAGPAPGRSRDRRRFGPELAEDLAQETFARTLNASDAIRSPRAFLLRVALNTARNQLRDAAARPQLAPEGPESDRAAAPAEQPDLLLLKETILALPPKLRDVFLLSRFGGLTYGEISVRLGIPLKTVEWRMSKAIRLCVARMRD
jgi:RNA polymerase sigma-70 factor (ECF subfamily)